ncbi:signal transduction histidine kinase [Brevundimonas variabilis]|uniref:histidine kinase n=2 Tax=Brevundimonas variabilis TaxID=74312 RepID=A0A7W9FE22_9CAUL|nr:signal transduction histidine kinase [Brevundimonas variabilis]
MTAQVPSRPAYTAQRESGGLKSLTPMLTAVFVALLTIVAVQTARSVDLIVALWLANAVAAGMWLKTGRGLAHDFSFGALMTMGVLAGEFLAGNDTSTSLIFTAANMIEIIGAVLLARRFSPSLILSGVDGTVRFVMATAILAPIPAALLASIAMIMVRDAPFLISFQTWWFGHALGLATVTPLILAIDRTSLIVFRDPWRAAEAVLLFGLLAAAAYFAYFYLPVPALFLVVPILIVIAVRMRITGISLALVFVSICSIAAILGGYGPPAFDDVPVSERILLAQLNLLFGCLPIMLVASLLQERDRFSARAKAGQLRAEQASEAKSRLLANVAHEIKSPVGGVIGIGDLWSSGQLGPVTTTQKEMADMLVKTARQVEALAHDLLDVARAESGTVKVELRPTDVTGVLEDVRRSTALRPEAEHLRLSVVCEGDGLVVLADSQRLVQIIDNLATNAVKYGGAGGVILFRASPISDGVRIEVTDRGPGLSEAKQAQLFEPFNRLGLERTTVEGHGIGLALAKRMVELMGGSIGVTSKPGEGATFWIELPAP